MSEQSLQLLQRIRRRLNDTARRITLADLLFGLAVSLGIVSGIWFIAVGLEAGLWMETTTRTILFWLQAALVVGLLLYFVILPLLRLAGILPGPSAALLAGRIGDHFPEVGDRLVNLLDLSEGRRTESPDALVDGAVQMLGRQVEPVSFEKIETFSRPRRALRMAAIPLASLLLFVAAAPTTFVDASKRLLSPGVHFQAPAPFSLIVEPGDQQIAKGSSMEIRVRARGEALPRTLSLMVRNADEDHVEEIRLSADSTGVFRHQVANVRRAFEYRASAHPVLTPWFRTDVTEHPLVRSLQVTLRFPGYSGIPPQRLESNVGDVTGLPGTVVSLEAQVGGSEADEAFVLFDDGETALLELDGDRAAGEFRLTREGSYQVIITNSQGIQNQDPIAYSMSLISDAAPSVVLLHPEPDAVLSDQLQSILVARLADDFGFHDLRLHYRLAESRFGEPQESFEALSMPLNDPRQLDQEVRFDWDVSGSTSLDPVPGDVIEYFVEVRDNDAFSGFKSARSAVHRLRLPSLAEQYEQLSEEQDDVESQMEDMQREADQMREQFQELRDEIRRKQEGDWEDERQLEQLQEHQSRMEKQARQLSEQIESMNRTMEQNNLLSEETLEMYKEMQKVVEEVNSPELMEALRQLQEAVQNMNLQQMQQAMEDFDFNEEQYRERLERALELFKNLRTQQALEEAARRAEELAKQQERLAEETKKLEEERSDRAGDEDERDRDAEQEGEQEPDEDSDGRKEEQQDSGAQEQKEDQQSGKQEQQGDQQSGEQESESQEQSGEQDPSEQQSSEQQSGDQQPSSPEKLAQEQERSKEEMEQLQELLDQIREQMEELSRSPQDKMQQLNEQVQQQQLPQKMQQNAEQLRQQQMQNARQGQQQMQQQLQQLQSQLSQMQQGMQGQQMQMNMAGLRRALSDVLMLSQNQEDLRDGVRNTVSETPSLREDARQQVELSEGLSTVIDSLQQLAKNIPQMSREVQRHAGLALREMGNATDAMTERSVSEASGHQKASMMHLNELALMLSEVMNQMMNASGAGSGGANMQQMIQQMQQMAGEQQKLNQQIQQFLNDAQGNRLSVDMQQRLQQMGAQQRAIQQQLEDIRRNPEARGKLLGDLEKISQQMEETIRELEQRQVNPEMVERQQQILQRLLDAQRSIHQRGQEEKRESREGRDVPREGPGALPPADAADKLRRDLIEALESGYAPDYEELIKRYFELLQKQTIEQE